MSLTYRFELKYFMSPEDARALESDIKRFGMCLDDHVDKKLGYYIVTSLYFDSGNNQHYDDKSGGLIERKKIRLRNYGSTLFTTKKIWIEIKHKFELKNAKTRLLLNESDARSLIEHGPNILYKNKNQHARDIILRSFYEIGACPTIYVRYKRKAYHDPTFDLRITFDYDIEGTRFSDENINRYNIPVNAHQVLLEVKFLYMLPPWFAYVLKSYNLAREAHSKFALCTERVNRFKPLAR